MDAISIILLPLQAMQYMELLLESHRPVSGTHGAVERRRKLLSQLPVYDHDPMKCQSLATDQEVQYCAGIILPNTEFYQRLYLRNWQSFLVSSDFGK